MLSGLRAVRWIIIITFLFGKLRMFMNWRFFIKMSFKEIRNGFRFCYHSFVKYSNENLFQRKPWIPCILIFCYANATDYAGCLKQLLDFVQIENYYAIFSGIFLFYFLLHPHHIHVSLLMYQISLFINMLHRFRVVVF